MKTTFNTKITRQDETDETRSAHHEERHAGNVTGFDTGAIEAGHPARTVDKDRKEQDIGEENRTDFGGSEDAAQNAANDQQQREQSR